MSGVCVCGVQTSSLVLVTFSFLFSFLSLSCMIFMSEPPNFQSNPSVCFAFRYGLYYFDYYLFYFKWFIYFFQFYPPLIYFHLSNLISILFIAIFFVLDPFLDWIFFCPLTLISFYFNVKLSPYYFNSYLFYFGNCFSISSFSVKLFGNWVSWLNLSQGFHRLRVWIINSNLEDFSKFAFFFFFYTHVFVSFILDHLFIS